MGLTTLQIDILELLSNQKRNANAVQADTFPELHASDVNEAIFNLYSRGVIDAVQSKATGNWLANQITPNGHTFMRQNGWYTNQ